MNDRAPTISNDEQLMESQQTDSSISPLFRRPALPNRSLEVWAAIECSWLGVILTGGVYGFVVPLGIIIFMFYRNIMLSGFGFEIMAVMAVMILGPSFAIILTAFWSMVAMLMIAIVNETFGSLLSRRVAVAVFGGLTGFLATFWWLLEPPGLEVLLINICFVALAVLMGQTGALVWAGRSGIWEMTRAATPANQVGFQFQLRHLFVGMIWCSGVLALDQLCPNHELVMLLGGYLLFQLFLIWVGGLFEKRRIAKAKRKRVRI